MSRSGILRHTAAHRRVEFFPFGIALARTSTIFRQIQLSFHAFSLSQTRKQSRQFAPHNQEVGKGDINLLLCVSCISTRAMIYEGCFLCARKRPTWEMFAARASGFRNANFPSEISLSLSLRSSMVAMTLGLQPSGFESRVRLGCIFFGKEVGLSPEMDSRLERKSSAPLLVICWDHRL
ncbi:hypothetical protein TNCV_3378811 [Trichonephila clavipes]|nr:hypothetical protein TNCV_3378811 [Trichonephila clavipes]